LIAKPWGSSAFLHQICAGHPFCDALVFTTSIASASVLREKPGDFCLNDTQDLLKKIHINRLN